MKKSKKKCKCGETDQSKLIVEGGYTRNLCRDCRRVYNNQRRNKGKRTLVDYKGGECEECKYSEYLQALCFHHIDPKTKDPDARNLCSWSLKRAKTEVDKCQLLCGNCHQFIHHGKEYKDMEPKYTRTTEPFLCKYCAEQDEDKMQLDSRSGKKCTTICKECRSQKNTQRIRKNKEFLVEHMGGCCSKCKVEYHPCVYEFHHPDPSKKDPNFKDICKWPLDRAKKELEKCIMICVNCHTEIHFDEKIKEEQ